MALLNLLCRLRRHSLTLYRNFYLETPVSPPPHYQVRDHMHRAIQDYLCGQRCEWMQKWPGMCVLNASQLHWTSETEQLLVEKKEEAPAAMLKRQVRRDLFADLLRALNSHTEGTQHRTEVGNDCCTCGIPIQTKDTLQDRTTSP